MDAKNMEAYQGLELAYEEAENYKEALDIQEILISFEPGKQENEIKLIELMAKNGDIEGALERLEEIGKDNSDNPNDMLIEHKDGEQMYSVYHRNGAQRAGTTKFIKKDSRDGLASAHFGAAVTHRGASLSAAN